MPDPATDLAESILRRQDALADAVDALAAMQSTPAPRDPATYSTAELFKLADTDRPAFDRVMDARRARLTFGGGR